MKTRFTILTAALALLTFLAVPMGMRGQTRGVETFTFSEMGYSNAADVTTVVGDDVTLTFAAGTNANNAPKYYTTGTGVRMYTGNTLEVALNNQTSDTRITAINFTFSGSYSGSLTNWTGSETSVSFTNTASGQARIQVIAVTFADGDTPQPTTYTVTYDCNGGTSGCPENETGLEAGDEITLADGPVKENYDFAGWSDGNTTYDEGDEYTVNGNVTFTAQWTEQVSGDVHWVLTGLTDLTASDVFVIVGDGYAMTNNNGTGSAPAPVAVTIANDEITSTVAATIQWTLSGDATNGYTFYPNGSTVTWLYCNTTSASSNNNNMRVGTGNRKVFELASNKIKTKDDYTARYLSLYIASGATTPQDWRGYTGTTSAPDMQFYKKITGGVVPPSITASNVEIAYDATSGSIAYTINNEPSPAGTLTAAVTDDNWLTLGQGTASPIAFTCTANENTTERTATVTLTYTYDTDQTVTASVTVTQAAAPVIYDDIENLFNAATSTATDVTVSFESWFVTGVSTNGKNVFVTDGTNGFVIFDNGGNLGDTYHANDLIEGTTTASLVLYTGFAELKNVDATNLTMTSYEAPAFADVAMANLSGINTGALVHYENLTCSVDNNKYYLSDGTTTLQVYNALYAFGSALEANHIYNITGVYQQYNNTKEILPRSANDIEEVVSAEPSITVADATVSVDAEGAEGTLTVTYESITEVVAEVWFCNADGTIDATYDWIIADINTDNNNNVDYLVEPNEGEARTAYFKVWAYDDELNEVYSNIVTVNQAEYVAPSIATLPFEFDGGKAAIENTDGLSQEGLGNDYNGGNNATTPLKFDNTGDWLLLQFDERPGTLTFDITGNTFSGGTFTVQTSEDGVTYTDLATYTELGATQNEEFNNLGENVRYIKWIYTNKSGGNVGLGTIALAEYEAPLPSITLNSYSIEATTEETEGTLTVTYTEIETEVEPEIYWFESDGVTEASEPDWMSAEINAQLNVDYLIAENEGEARTAYFKVYGLDVDGDEVYSDLVTVSQAGVPQQYTLEVTSISNAEIFVFDATDPDETNWVYLFEGIDEVQVLEGTTIALSVSADPGYVLESLMVNNDNVISQLDESGAYTFTMPASNVTITVTAAESVAPAGGNYVRITSLDQLTDGSKVIIAARYDDDHTDGYYAMPGQTSGKPEGVAFTSVTSGNDEILPATITASEDTYYWTVNVTEDGYTFMNAEEYFIGYPNSGTDFITGGYNTAWTIARETAANTAMVDQYIGFVIRNGYKTERAFAFNGEKFGAYATSNMNAGGYNFYLDFFVQQEAVETETHTLTVDGYTDDNTKDGYCLIASPVTVDPSTVTGMTDGDFDLYYFDESEDDEWRNYEATSFNLVPGRGYLYAKKATTETPSYSFELTGIPYNNEPIILSKSESGDFAGWNLVGNPFGDTAYLSDVTRDFYVMNSDGSDFIETSGAIAPMQGFFVVADVDGEELVFNTTSLGGITEDPNGGLKLVLNLTKGNSLLDRAVVRFGEGRTLPKFMLNADNTKIYITEGNQDYAVVRSSNEGEMPVSFKAAENGNYTISIDAENVEANYLHLLDNMTGADVDLLATPSYSFEARTTDFANRFRLVFNANGVDEAMASFAYFNGSEWIVNNMDEATLQVVDMMGRVISTQAISGNAEVGISQVPGVYMLRLVNGDNVKVQKVVVR